MKYQAPIDLWAKGMQANIAAGRVKIQRGQWVYCGNPDHLSRYVGHTEDGYFDVVHWSGSKSSTAERFLLRCEVMRAQALYDTDKPAYMAHIKAQREAARLSA